MNFGKDVKINVSWDKMTERYILKKICGFTLGIHLENDLRGWGKTPVVPKMSTPADTEQELHP